MDGWEAVLLAIVPAVILLLLLLLVVLLRRCCRRGIRNSTGGGRKEENMEAATESCSSSNHGSCWNRLGSGEGRGRQSYNYNILRHGAPVKLSFNWSDHPGLVSQAVEAGWPRFAFNIYPSSSVGAIWDLCSAGVYETERLCETSWEFPPGGSECMQKLSLRPGSGNDNPAGVCYAIAALPLPGPSSEVSFFPPEAYFEVTIRPEACEIDAPAVIQKLDVVSDAGDSLKSQTEPVAQLQRTTTERTDVKHVDRINEQIGLITLGLTCNITPPLKPPGTYSGSIGFNSNGSVNLNGMKLTDPKQGEWGREERIVGCGFDPARKKIIMTLNSQLLHVIYCNSEEFGYPLYPILAASADVTAFVNMGQSSFTYASANLQRTPNPRLRRRPPEAAGLAQELESSELFSIGRMNSRWPSAKRSGYHDMVAEDFFEIPLDVGRSR